MIEESVLEHERRGNFIRVFPSENHMSYRNFFEEERRNDTVLFNYIYNRKYKNQPIYSWELTNGIKISIYV